MQVSGPPLDCGPAGATDNGARLPGRPVGVEEDVIDTSLSIVVSSLSVVLDTPESSGTRPRVPLPNCVWLGVLALVACSSCWSTGLPHRYQEAILDRHSWCCYYLRLQRRPHIGAGKGAARCRHRNVGRSLQGAFASPRHAGRRCRAGIRQRVRKTTAC